MAEPSTLDIALAYQRAGLSVVPIRLDGSKAPKGQWKEYQHRLPTEAEISKLWSGSKPPGIAICGGEVSGSVECIDFDYDADRIFDEWCDAVEAEAPGLISRITIIQTPRWGFHVVFRCPGIQLPGNTKLAQITVTTKNKTETRTAIETRGRGGYFLTVGSPRECHESGWAYAYFSGPPLTKIATISRDEREVLMGYARSFDARINVKEDHEPAQRDGLSAGDDFCHRGPGWPGILEPHGWKLVRQTGEEQYWQRPGKEGVGWSATTGKCRSKAGRELLHVFSTNASPFEPGDYNKFATYAILNHNGNFKAAAKQLAQEGYGTPRSQRNGHTPLPPAAGPSQKSGLVTTCLANIKPQPIYYIVPDRLPLSKMVLVAGDGGHGKTMLALQIAADLSMGRPCLGLDYPVEIVPSDTLIVSCEDDFADTIVPRLIVAGADLTRIYRVDGVRGPDGKIQSFNLSHYEAIEQQLIENPNIRLVIIDPAGAYIGKTGRDDHNDSELRSLLGPLAELAAKHEVTILLVKHLNKGITAKAVHRVSGSTGYINAVRAAFMVAPDPDDENRKLFLPLKFNLGPKPLGLSYRLQRLSSDEQDPLQVHFAHLDSDDRERLNKQLFRIEWLGSVEMSADDACAGVEKKEKRPNKTEQASAWLRDLLIEFAYPGNEIFALAAKQGFSKDSCYEAKKRLGVQANNKGAFGGVWHWGFGNPAEWVLRPEPGQEDAEGRSID